MSNILPSNIVDFANPDTALIEREIKDPAVVDFPYQSRSWRHFTDPDKKLVSGIWEAGPHLERCTCDYHELCHILEGSVRLTDQDGTSRIFGPGDSFVVRAGFSGTWENLTSVRKIYLILEV